MIDPRSSSVLSAASVGELEQIYREAPMARPPVGWFRGKFLRWLPTPGARRLSVRLADGLLFQTLPFGVDFDRRLWWFVRPPLGVGRFEVSAGPSRWRDTETLRLRYHSSRLPRPVRALLYDEVKPLSDHVCLGLGGLDAGPGEGDHFYFLLTRD